MRPCSVLVRFARMINAHRIAQHRSGPVLDASLWVCFILAPIQPMIRASRNPSASGRWSVVQNRSGEASRAIVAITITRFRRTLTKCRGIRGSSCTLWQADHLIAKAQNQDRLESAQSSGGQSQAALRRPGQNKSIRIPGAPLSVSPLTWSHRHLCLDGAGLSGKARTARAAGVIPPFRKLEALDLGDFGHVLKSRETSPRDSAHARWSKDRVKPDADHPPVSACEIAEKLRTDLDFRPHPSCHDHAWRNL